MPGLPLSSFTHDMFLQVRPSGGGGLIMAAGCSPHHARPRTASLRRRRAGGGKGGSAISGQWVSAHSQWPPCQAPCLQVCAPSPAASSLPHAAASRRVCSQKRSAVLTASFPAPRCPAREQMCILTGCDFLAGLQGIGVRKAHGYVRKYKGFTRVRGEQEGAGGPAGCGGHAASFGALAGVSKHKGFTQVRGAGLWPGAWFGLQGRRPCCCRACRGDAQPTCLPANATPPPRSPAAAPQGAALQRRARAAGLRCRIPARAVGVPPLQVRSGGWGCAPGEPAERLRTT